MTLFFTADEHYLHKNIIKYCSRPFESVDDMTENLIKNHNSVVGKGDVTVHLGDFCFGNQEQAEEIIKRLNGNHIFIKGCHDRWLRKSAPAFYKISVNDTLIVGCHYPLEEWFASFHGSIHVHGHQHKIVNRIKNRLNVGADLHKFFPINAEEVIELVKINNETIGDH